MIAFLALVVGFILGIPFGATIVREFLDGLWLWPRHASPARLPVARLLTRAEQRRLEVPTVLRKRQRIDVIDVG